MAGVCASPPATEVLDLPTAKILGKSPKLPLVLENGERGGAEVTNPSERC